ncbi:DNA topoisomerase III [Vallitalea sp.]|jgi:DNA topoisomerase-3|uniref:DNA topoisomerase III n=1 Tax=Vallitalea sp. TaxID=1882829 RepID=UPI0025E5F421|nr:DNA topoisomerase III [Vallitalea sp.]MCT4688148.1 DNA topoisomerase III [Vallitalea sp.]
MGKTLVLAEKPSVGREIGRVLSCKRKSDGALYGDKYVVTWALGHLVTLANPESYHERYKSWNMNDLPMLPEKMKLVVIKKTSRQFGVVKNLMNSKDITEIVIATDAGREGELVARWIIEKARVKKPIKRLWISSQTDKAIKDGFKNLKDGKTYWNLYRSAFARSKADWFVGLNLTRALTCKHNVQLSAGRVQTPTLNMIVQREKEINKFVPAKYWEIKCSAKNVEFNLLAKEGNSRIFNKEKRDSILNKLKNVDGVVKSVEEKVKKINAPYAYDLTTLQIDANNKYGFSAKRTLQIMQQLYEHHKAVTYPRTDSKYISKDIVPTLKERLESITSSSYKGFARALIRTKLNISSRFVDDKKVTDHHAIIPTEQTVFLNDLSSDERKIYDLIVKRFLEVLSKPCEYKEIKVRLSVKDELFNVTYKNIINQGWKQIGSGNEDIKNEQIKFKKNDKVKIDKVFYNEGLTKPPSRYTEALLLADMENPKRFVKENKMKETLSSVGGIGTVATRADIIEKLYNTYYIENKDGKIHPTSKGKQLVELVPEDIKSPILTAKWEMELTGISKGNVKESRFTENIKNYTKELVEKVKKDNVTFKHDNITGEKCPDCGSNLLKVNNKKGEMLVCKDRECGYKKMLNRATNARCPQCHKKMIMVGEGDKKMFICNNCGFKEKLTSWNKRKEAKSNQMNKKQVKNYMNKMKKDAEKPLNNAFADSLSKLNI